MIVDLTIGHVWVTAIDGVITSIGYAYGVKSINFGNKYGS
jgi:hypothetical protein